MLKGNIIIIEIQGYNMKGLSFQYKNIFYYFNYKILN